MIDEHERTVYRCHFCGAKYSEDEKPHYCDVETDGGRAEGAEKTPNFECPMCGVNGKQVPLTHLGHCEDGDCPVVTFDPEVDNGI